MVGVDSESGAPTGWLNTVGTCTELVTYGAPNTCTPYTPV